jgi:nucleoside-diphosphate-sugar epimerase
MNVLVTGHHGYIGSVTAPFLRAAGHDVVGLDTFFYDGCNLTSGVELPHVRLDVRDVTADHLKGYDAVVHLAALSNDPLGDMRPELTFEINYEATVALAEAAREAGVGRFVFASSCSMYGAAGTGDAIDETGELHPLTPYAESKVRSEAALSALACEGFSPVYMRNATAYGASPRLRLDVVLNNLVGWAFTTGEIRILSDGTPWRPLVHVEDIARTTAALLEAPPKLVHDEAFNVGLDSENYQVSRLAEIVQEATPSCRIEYAGSGDPDPRSYRVDFTKLARTFPGLTLQWSAAAGAAELVAAYNAAGMTYEDFVGARFTRLTRLKELTTSGVLDGELRWREGLAQHAVA